LIRQAADLFDTRPVFDRAQQFAEGDFSLAAHQIIDAHFLVSLRREAGIVPAHYDLHSRPQGTDQLDDASRGATLKCHDGEPDNLRIELADKPGYSLANLALNQDQIGDGHAVLRINISRQRRERAIGHTDSNRWHVLERIGHGK